MGVSESIEGPKHNAMRGGSPQLSINSESQGVRCTFETNVFNVDIRPNKKYVLPYFSPIEKRHEYFIGSPSKSAM